MRTPIIRSLLVACLLLLALPAASAYANAADNRIIQDCQRSETGTLGGSYSKAQLNHALHNLPGDVLEYSGCYDVIRQALLGSAGGNGNGSGAGGNGNAAGGGFGGFGGAGGGAAGAGEDGTGSPAGGGAGTTGAIPNNPPPAGAERPIEVAGATLAPGSLPEIGQDSHRLPTSLLVLLVLLGGGALATAALTIGRRVIARRRA
jgi:hypothetical protein